MHFCHLFIHWFISASNFYWAQSITTEVEKAERNCWKFQLCEDSGTTEYSRSCRDPWLKELSCNIQADHTITTKSVILLKFSLFLVDHESFFFIFSPEIQIYFHLLICSLMTPNSSHINIAFIAFLSYLPKIIFQLTLFLSIWVCIITSLSFFLLGDIWELLYLKMDFSSYNLLSFRLHFTLFFILLFFNFF